MVSRKRPYSSEVQAASARYATAARDGKDPELAATRRRELGAIMLEAHVKEVVERFPPLTQEQIDKIVSLLHGADLAITDSAPPTRDELLAGLEKRRAANRARQQRRRDLDKAARDAVSTDVRADRPGTGR